MDQVWRKSVFEVRTLVLATTMLAFASVDARSAGNCVFTDPRAENQNCGDVSLGERPIPNLLAELSSAQVQSLDVAMRELHARRRDWRLHEIALHELNDTFELWAQRPEDVSGREGLSIHVDEKTFRFDVTDYRNQRKSR